MNTLRELNINEIESVNGAGGVLDAVPKLGPLLGSIGDSVDNVTTNSTRTLTESLDKLVSASSIL